MWTGPDKAGPLLPKSDGDGRMISGMQSWDFGFGLLMDMDQLAQVNITCGNKQYVDVAAATEINYNVNKPLLTTSPFLHSLTIGTNNDGYWTS